MMVEVFIQLPPSKLDLVREELRSEGPPSDLRRRTERFVKQGLRAERQWRQRTAGPPHQVMCSIMEVEELRDVMVDLDPNASVLGVWKRDGLPLGVEYTRNAEDEITGTRGTPTFPIDADAMLDAMPDVFEYDQDGNVIGSSRPSRLIQAHRYMGWADRVYDVGALTRRG